MPDRTTEQIAAAIETWDPADAALILIDVLHAVDHGATRDEIRTLIDEATTTD